MQATPRDRSVTPALLASAAGDKAAVIIGFEPTWSGAHVQARAEAETGVTADDPMRFGADRLLDAVLASL